MQAQRTPVPLDKCVAHGLRQPFPYVTVIVLVYGLRKSLDIRRVVEVYAIHSARHFPDPGQVIHDLEPSAELGEQVFAHTCQMGVPKMEWAVALGQEHVAGAVPVLCQLLSIASKIDML